MGGAGSAGMGGRHGVASSMGAGSAGKGGSASSRAVDGLGRGFRRSAIRWRPGSAGAAGCPELSGRGGRASSKAAAPVGEYGTLGDPEALTGWGGKAASTAAAKGGGLEDFAAHSCLRCSRLSSRTLAAAEGGVRAGDELSSAGAISVRGA